MDANKEEAIMQLKISLVKQLENQEDGGISLFAVLALENKPAVRLV